jgi:CRISPR-associated protein Cmr4
MTDTKTYYALAVDPLHIGTGGYRLGRVDNTIVREPGTGIPKVPGSSISGVCRNYTIYRLEETDKLIAVKCAKNDTKKQNNCGHCVICKTFGFSSAEEKTNQMGLIKFFDAMIVAFPVATMFGPVWVTTAEILREHGVSIAALPGTDVLYTTFANPVGKLNLGWLYLESQKIDNVKLPSATALTPPSPQINTINDRLVIAPNWLFSEIVNANLEVRTSVAIDFKTGAAKSGALFTYEAIPRTTLLAFDIVVDAYRCNGLPDKEKVWKILKNGLQLFEVLGLGGMNTRGFGRMKVINL